MSVLRFVFAYLQLKRYTNFAFIVIQNQNVIHDLRLSLFRSKMLCKLCVYRHLK